MERSQLTKNWGIDRRISITNLAQLVAIIIFGVSFYNQVNNNQSKNEDRFASFAAERKVQADQMAEMQKGQNQVILQLATITERQNYLTDSVKDLGAVLKERGVK